MSLTRASQHQTGYAKAGTEVFSLASIVTSDFSRIHELVAVVTLSNGNVVTATDIDALELAMLIKPSVLESRRLRWPRWAWLVHNLIGHPVMQILALFKLYKWAFWVHDATVPRPLGAR